MSHKYGVPDRENPEWTADEMRSARSGADVLPPAFIAGVRRRRGKQKTPIEEMVSLRVAPEVLEAYRATGKGWQVLMHATLAAHAPGRRQAQAERRVRAVPSTITRRTRAKD